MNILGISAFYHDSAACLVRDGEIIAAAEEERFSRKKHDQSFPAQAAAYCVRAGGIEFRDLDIVAFYDKPILKFDRLLETYVAYSPAGFKMFLMGLPLWLKQKLHVPAEIDRGLGHAYRNKYVFTEHHEAHAASAFFPSPFGQAAIITLDGVGEWTTGSIAVGRDHELELLKELRFPHSLGLLYSAFTYFVGFKVNSGEYKMMGLAPYGQPIYKDKILDNLLDLKSDGSFRLNLDYFAYCHDDVMTSRKLSALLGGPPRVAESEITRREMDIAASIQAVVEEIVLRIASYARAITRMDKLVMAGGVALNCVANGKLLRSKVFDDVWIQPAAGDAGGALGAALFVWHQLLGNPRATDGVDRQRGSFLGPAFSRAEIEAFLRDVGAVYSYYEHESDLCDAAAELIASQNIVGHVAGRMEFGPRALGARSILADARSPDMQRVLNLKIKFRESFRPFAPSVLQEDAHAYFDMEPGQESPYMLLVADLKPDKRVDAASNHVRGLDQVNDVRSVVPAVTHVDHSARVHTIDKARNPRLHGIVHSLKQKTGCPMVINTSFNVRGEPIVRTPSDAYRCFMATHMDALVIENFILRKDAQPAAASFDRRRYLGAFEQD